MNKWCINVSLTFIASDICDIVLIFIHFPLMLLIAFNSLTLIGF
jgi:hypothetical protein